MSQATEPDETYSPAMSRIAALRRVSGAEIVDEGIQLARQNYGAMIMAALVPLLPILGMRIWASSVRLGLWNYLLILFNSFWTSLAVASAARVAMDALEVGSTDPARALRIALRRAWPVVLCGLYRTTFALLGFVLLVIPGLYVVSVYALIPILPVVEPGMGAWQTLRRSATLTRGARLLAFGTYFAPYAVVAGSNLVLTTLTARALGPHAGRLFGGLVGGSVVLALLPFLAAIQVRLYVELRMRREAIDIEWALSAPNAGVAS